MEKYQFQMQTHTTKVSTVRPPGQPVRKVLGKSKGRRRQGLREWPVQACAAKLGAFKTSMLQDVEAGGRSRPIPFGYRALIRKRYFPDGSMLPYN